MQIIKYTVTSIVVFGLVHFLSESYLNYKVEILDFLPELLLLVGIGIGGYLGMTYLIDKKTRNLFQQVIAEIKKGKNEKG